MTQKKLDKESEKILEYYKSLGCPINGYRRFVKDFLSTLVPCAIPEFHVELFNTIRKTRRVAIAAPRSFAKTTLVDVIYPIYRVFVYRSDRKNIVIFSASQGLAEEQIKKIKHEFDTNSKLIEFYVKLYGKMPHDDKMSWRNDEIQFSNGITIQARGAGGQTRGRRPDVVICDDLETTDGVRSPEQRKQLDEWFRKDILGLLNPDGQLILIGTILHYASLLKCIISEMKDYGWFTKVYKAYNDGIQEKGKELWVEKWPHEALQKRKQEQGSTYFSSEYMNEPVDDASAPIKTEHIRNWVELPDKYNMVIAVDPAYSEDSKSDYKVAVCVACDSKNNRYLVKYIRTHNTQGDFFNAILNMWQLNKHCINAIGIPNQGVEKSFFNAFVKFCEEKNMFPPIKELQNRGAGNSVSIRNKKDRIIATLQPIFEQGKYYIHSSHEEAKEELLGIGYTRNDDVVDAMTYAEQLIQPCYSDIVYTNSEAVNYNSNIDFNKIANYGME